MTNYNSPEQYDDNYALAQERLAEFGKTIQLTKSEVEPVQLHNASDSGSALDILRGGKEEAGGFRPIEIPADQLLDTPQLLGRILLMNNSRLGVRSPAAIARVAGQPTMLRIAMLDQPFVPQTGFSGDKGTGLTKAAHFDLTVDKETSGPAFGGHDTADGAVEGGHFGVALTTAVSEENAEALVALGDVKSDQVIGSGIVREFGGLGMVDKSIIPEVRFIDVTKIPPGVRLPLYWHEDLDKNGPALLNYPGATEKILGAAIGSIGLEGLDKAAGYVDLATAGRR